MICAWCPRTLPPDAKVSHGICRKHLLEQLRKLRLLTQDEETEYTALWMAHERFS